MPDPFAQSDPSQMYLGGMPAPQQPPSQPAKSVVGSMLAPASLKAPVQFPGVTPPAAPQPAQQGGNVDQFMQLVRAHESGGNDKATSGVADGRYQFTPQTWNGVIQNHPELGLRPNDIWDGAKQDLAMRAISKDYEQVLSLNGIPATMPNMFMLHFLGTGGGPKFLKQMAANPNADAAAAFPLEAKYNPTIFWGQGGQPRTLQQVYALMTKTFGGPPIDPRTATQPASMSDPAMAFKPVAEMLARKQPAEDDLKPLPGMTPIVEDDLKPLPGMTPIGDGLKLDYNAKAPLTSANPYAADAAAKSDDKAPEVIGVDPTTGTPIFADDKENAAVREGEIEMGKGFAAGVAQDITGPASLLPNWLGGGKAEEANRALNETGNPFARGVGNIAPSLVPLGGVVGAAKAGQKAIEAGESLLPSMGKAFGFGSAAGALNASSKPTDATSEGGRIAAKAPGMIEEGLASGLLSGAIPGVGSAARWLTGEISDVFGKEAAKAAEDLRTGFDARTGKELSEEARAAKIATIERAAEKKVIAEQAARSTAPPEKVGKDLQGALDADRKEVVERRKVESGFADAVKSDGGQPLIKTKDATNEIANIEKKFDVDLSDLKSKLATKADTRGGPTVRGVSIERGRYFVELLNNKIEGMESGPAHALMKVRDDFVDHMETTHPQLKAAREKYAELSRDVDIYERKGKLAKASESDLYSKQPITDPTKVASLLTDKTEAGGQAIKRLVERDKTGKVQESIRQHFNHELFGSGGATKTPSVDQMRRFMEKNRVALENSGLYKEFEKLKSDREAFEKPADVRKAALDAHHEIATIRTELKSARKPEEIVAASRKALSMLIKDKRIPQSEYEQLLNEVKDVEQDITDHKKALAFAKKLGAILAVGVGGEEIGRYLAHRYSP